MSRIEFPTTETEIQDLVDRYGPTTVTIGRNQVLTARVNAFIDEFVSPEAEPLEYGNESYTQRLTSGVTLGGMMIHARLHRLPHTVEASKQYILVTDSFYDTEPEQYWFAGSKYVDIDALTTETHITATEFAAYGKGPRMVEDPVAPSEDPADDAFEQVLARQGWPQMITGNNVHWRTRVAPKAYDDMDSILDIRDSVAKMRAELGVRVLRQSAQAAERELPRTGSDQ